MNEKVKDILEWILCIVIALVLALLIRYYIGTPTIVKQVSMKTTLLQDDRLILNRWGRTTKKLPERGDIITFEAPTNARWSKEEQDLSNPIAKYENEPSNIWESLVHNVLEWGKESYIKRVIALPGEHVEIKDDKVYINGEELQEDYLQPGVVTNMGDFGVYSDFVVPENCVFAMGDNRTQSTDCRVFGCIPLEKIEGKVWIRFWPLNKFGHVD